MDGGQTRPPGTRRRIHVRPLIIDGTLADCDRYGPLKVEHKKRTIAHRRGRKDLAPEQRPQNVQPQQTQQQKDDTVNGVFRVRVLYVPSIPADDVQCSKLLKELDQGDGLNFFKFAINPDDFGQSVENVFYLSFLVKDGKAGLKVSEDGEMRICQLPPSTTKLACRVDILQTPPLRQRRKTRRWRARASCCGTRR